MTLNGHLASNGLVFWLSETRAVLLPGNRAKPCKFRYVKSVRSFMWKLCYRKGDHAMRPICGCPENVWTPSLRPTATIPKIFSWAFVPIDPMNVPTKFEVCSFTRSWDNRGTPKIWAAPGYAHTYFSPKFLMGFIRIGPVNVLAKFEVSSFTRSRDNRGTQKIWTVPGYAHALFFPKFLTDFYSEWPYKYIPQIWSL